MSNLEQAIVIMGQMLEMRRQTREMLRATYAQRVTRWVSVLRDKGVGPADVRKMLGILKFLQTSGRNDAVPLAVSAFVEMHEDARTPGLVLPEAKP